MSLIYEGEDYYRLLGVDPGASSEQIRNAYRRLAHLTHPDAVRHSDTGLCFQHVRQAYEVLSDPDERRLYDLAMGFVPSSPSGHACRAMGKVFHNFFGGLHRVIEHARDVTHELEENDAA
jgi:DnaJ-class molecular chaperone